MNRGILATIYVGLAEGADAQALHDALAQRYRDEPFVQVLPMGSLPATRHVRGSNACHIAVHADRVPGRAILLCAIDNLVKGASGQALQNLNVMFGLDEREGLAQPAIFLRRGAMGRLTRLICRFARRYRAGREGARGRVVRTPAIRAAALSDRLGCTLVLKLENQQYTSSFKDRGACVRLASLDDDAKRRGVIAMSAGNHAQGVAYHATRLGIPSTIVMPTHTPFVKVEKTRALGARVRLEGDMVDDAAVFARELAAAENLTFIHPYDDPLIIAGQGTVALELLADYPDLDVLVVPTVAAA